MILTSGMSVAGSTPNPGWLFFIFYLVLNNNLKNVYNGVDYTKNYENTDLRCIQYIYCPFTAVAWGLCLRSYERRLESLEDDARCG